MDRSHNSLQRQYLPVVCVLLFGALPVLIPASPLVYPNRFSFQKTTPSTTEVPSLFNHDLANNNSIVPSEAGSQKSGFRFNIIAGWSVGVTCVVCVLAFLYYSRKKKVYERGVGITKT